MIKDDPSDSWTSRYEQLRHVVMNGTWSESGNWGLALLMRRGLAAWMRAWPSSSEDRSPATTAADTVALKSPMFELPETASSQLVMILTNMVFRARQEVVA